jgi:hypothetical protein
VGLACGAPDQPRECKQLKLLARCASVDLSFDQAFAHSPHPAYYCTSVTANIVDKPNDNSQDTEICHQYLVQYPRPSTIFISSMSEHPPPHARGPRTNVARYSLLSSDTRSRAFFSHKLLFSPSLPVSSSAFCIVLAFADLSSPLVYRLPAPVLRNVLLCYN